MYSRVHYLDDFNRFVGIANQMSNLLSEVSRSVHDGTSPVTSQNAVARSTIARVWPNLQHLRAVIRTANDLLPPTTPPVPLMTETLDGMEEAVLNCEVNADDNGVQTGLRVLKLQAAVQLLKEEKVRIIRQVVGIALAASQTWSKYRAPSRWRRLLGQLEDPDNPAASVSETTWRNRKKGFAANMEDHPDKGSRLVRMRRELSDHLGLDLPEFSLP